MRADRVSPRRWLRLVLPAVSLAIGCTEPVATAPNPELAFARGGGSGGPIVKSTTPSSGLVSTTLSVQVGGSGFEPGSRALWALNGDTTGTVTKVKTNSTTFVSSTQLIASITIESDASLALYDVMVITLQGKKGIGIELFEVTSQTVTAIAPKGVDSEALAINDGGQIVGLTDSSLGSARRSYLWTPSEPRGTTGVFSYLDGGSAASINNSGHVVGGMILGDGNTHAAFWSATHGWQDLGTLSNGAGSYARDISETGIVAGIGDSTGQQRAIAWSLTVTADGDVTASTATNLGTVAGGGGSVAIAVDPSGTYIVGWAHPSATQFANHPAIWTNGASGWSIRQLPLVAGDNFGMANGVNRYGDAVGTSSPSQGCNSAVLWASNGAVRLLPGFAGGCGTEAYAINDAGQIVGRADSGRFGLRAVMWTASASTISGPLDLGALPGAKFVNASCISANIAGLVQMAGYQRSTSGTLTPLLWNRM